MPPPSSFKTLEKYKVGDTFIVTHRDGSETMCQLIIRDTNHVGLVGLEDGNRWSSQSLSGHGATEFSHTEIQFLVGDGNTFRMVNITITYEEI